MGTTRIPALPLTPEGCAGKPLAARAAPAHVVLLRLQAFGDCVATFPVLAALKDRFPSCRVDVVTGPGTAALFEARPDVSRVHVLDPRAPRLRRLARLAALARDLERPDVILDLQRSRLTQLLARLARPRAWVSFDRFAPRTGLTRYRDAVAWVGLGALAGVFEARLAAAVAARATELLAAAGREPACPLVCLNPAGGWATKQWPLERYAALGARLRTERNAQLLLLGEGASLARVHELRQRLEGDVLDLGGRTTPDLAMAIVARASLVVSDDSGLLHLAWTQGVPALALFGASRAVWSRPEGPSSAGFYSEDLPCGACMQPVCARGDLLCLDRVTVEAAFAEALRLLRTPA